MLRLYGDSGSGSAAVEVALSLCGLEYELRRAATWRHEGRAQQAALAELTLANPLHQLPTLVQEDGTVLSESAAILMHLGLDHPRSSLLPRAASQRAQAMRGLVFIAANLYSAIGVIDHPERWIATEAGATKLRQGARARLHAMWSVFADVFHPDPAAPWLLQAARRGRNQAPPGALDLLAAVVSRWSGGRQHLKRERPALHALLERVDAHPAVAPVFARHWPVRSGF
jgi:GST-like protein